MFAVGIEATIGGTRFRRIHAVEIEHSIKRLGKSARIKLPTTARLERQGEFISEVEVAKQFSVGDEVIINMGYDGDLREEFRGYVRKIKPTVPLEIECEDAVYQLKRKPLQKTFTTTTLKQLLEFILEGTDIELVTDPPTINFRKFMFRNINAAKAIDKLRKEYGLTIYFSEFNKMVVGLASETDGTIVKYTIGQNVIKHDLEWEDEENVKLKIKAVSVSQNNQFTTKIVGDADGEQRTVYFYNLQEGEDLEERAKEELTKYRYAGYKGSLMGFLVPACEVGNTVRLKDENFDNREGDYMVESVRTSLGMGGGRRKVKLGLKLD